MPALLSNAGLRTAESEGENVREVRVFLPVVTR
jgi:hypothetical protein